VLNVTGTTNNYGAIEISYGQTFRQDGPMHNHGAISFWDGDVNVLEEFTATFYGHVQGEGDFPGPGTVVFLGGYSPGDSPAEVFFGGDLKLDGTLTMELGGTTPGDQYDVLHVADVLTLAGTLEVELIEDFTPQAGHIFDILDWRDLEGTFNTIELPALQSGLTWDDSSLYSNGQIQVVPEPSTFALAALGLLGLAFCGRRRKR